MFDYTIEFSWTLFRDRTKTGWSVCLLYLIRCKWSSKNGTEQNFFKTVRCLSLWCKKNTDANAFVSLCTRHWPRWRFGVLPISKGTHQTIMGSIIFVWIQEQGRCLAQLQVQAFSHWLDLESEEEQTNCVIGEVVSWPQTLWPWYHFPSYTICSSPSAVCSDLLVILLVNIYIR